MTDLSDAYANSAYIPDGESFPARWEAAADRFCAKLASDGRAEIDLSYGPTARERFDLYHPKSKAKGLMVFVHGGYWMAMRHSAFSHLAQGALDQGWAVAMPSYALCPEVRIAEITTQVSRAVQAAAARVAGPIVICGHSAGGHLAARMLARDVLSESVGARVRRVMPISPLSDLAPLMQTDLNEILKIDAAEAHAESPLHMHERYSAEVIVWVGGDERPAFIDQANWLSAAWGADVVIAPDLHHFNVIDALADGASAMMARLLA